MSVAVIGVGSRYSNPLPPDYKTCHRLTPTYLIGHITCYRYNWLHSCFNENRMVDEINDGEMGGSRSTQGIDRKLMLNMCWLSMKALRMRASERTR